MRRLRRLRSALAQLQREFIGFALLSGRLLVTLKSGQIHPSWWTTSVGLARLPVRTVSPTKAAPPGAVFPPRRFVLPSLAWSGGRRTLIRLTWRFPVASILRTGNVGFGPDGKPMQLKHLQYLVTLARERHFSRAAEACSVSQSALSQALRSIEAEFQVPIVDRGSQGFHGFTPQGERILNWARQVLADHDALTQELSESRAEALAGHIRIGAIPIIMPAISLITTALKDCHPNITASIVSMNFTSIDRCLDSFEIDIGIRHLDAAGPRGLRSYVLHEEVYYLLAPAGHPLAERGEITWREAAGLPLCLLTPDMRYRQILDGVFVDVASSPSAIIETNCAVALCSHVRSGRWFTIVPHSFFYLIGEWGQTRALRLVDPVVSSTIGMLIPNRNPLPPVTRALIDTVQSLDLDKELLRYLPPSPPS